MRSRALRIKSIQPAAGIEGGKVIIEGSGFDPEESSTTIVEFGGVPARTLLISSTRIQVQIPEDAKRGPVVVRTKTKSSNAFDFTLGEKIASGMNPVDSPIYDKKGNLYVAYGGKRGEPTPVSVYRIQDGEASPFLSNIANATSLALDPEGNLYISSRFEGTIYKSTPKADLTVFARDLGVPTGMVFDRAGFLFVGDRSGRILKISPDGEDTTLFAEIPESVVAFHLVFDLDGNLLVTNPGLSSYNSILMLDRYGKVIPLYGGFGRPQGIAVDASGNIYVCEAKIGESGVIRITSDGTLQTVVAAPVVVGVALKNSKTMAIASQNAVYELSIRPAASN